MADRKYASDYRLEDYVAPGGGRMTRRVYQGIYFQFCQSLDAIRSLGRKLLLAAGAVTALLLPLLFNNTQIGRTAYVLLPMAFTLLPLYHLAAVGVRLCRYDVPLTRQQKDLTDGRLRAASAWLAILLGITFGGCLAYWIRKGLQAGEMTCVLGIGLGFLVSLVLLPLKNMAKTEPVDT